jgi:hypothetical protein
MEEEVMTNPIDQFKQTLENEHELRIKPVYDFINNPMFSKKFKRETLDTLITTLVRDIREMEELRKLI